MAKSGPYYVNALDLKPCANLGGTEVSQSDSMPESHVEHELASGGLAAGLKSRRCDLEVKFKVAEQLCCTMSDDYYCIQQILIITHCSGHKY